MILGLVGKAGSGKDEFAKVAVAEFGYQRVAFADGVKEEVASFLDKAEVCWEHRHLWGTPSDKESQLRMAHSKRPKRGRLAEVVALFGDYNNGWWYFTPRKLMQVWGTEYRRHQDPEYWVKQGMKKAKGLERCVITDCRFVNEYAAISAAGGKIVKLHRSDAPIISNMQHQSEAELEMIPDDYTLVNEGTLEEYHLKVQAFLESIHGK